MKSIKKSALLKTSAKTDVKRSGGKVNITGLLEIEEKFIVSIKQTRYRAEVSQVVTIGASSYTPTADTVYSVLIGDPTRHREGSSDSLRKFSTTTPVVLVGTAAQQREAIHVALIAKINAGAADLGTAVTLGTGTGFTFTDKAGYYPARKQGVAARNGANIVRTAQDPDGTGFVNDYAVTTAAVYSSGVGLRLQQDVPVLDKMNGNLINGTLSAPVDASGNGAVEGQKYTLFTITCLQEVASFGGSGSANNLEFKEQFIFVDNGGGSSVTNLAGYLEFSREMHRLLAVIYGNTPSAILEFFDSPGIFQGAAGAVPTTTGQNKIATVYGQYVENLIGTGTITVVTPTATGYKLDHDITTTEGGEITPPFLLTMNPVEFTVGKSEFSVYFRDVVTTHANGNLLIGFRKKEAHQADYNDYNDGAWTGFIGALVETTGILGGAATVQTNTTVVPTNAAVESFEVLVDINGVVTTKYNGVTYPVYSVGTTPMVFAAGTVLIPDIIAVNNGGSAPVTTAQEWIALPDTNWIE